MRVRIVLEDDCLPAPDFVRFCATLLERYREDARVMHSAGKLPHGPRPESSSTFPNTR